MLKAKCGTCLASMTVAYAGHSDVHFCSDQCEERYADVAKERRAAAIAAENAPQNDD